MTLLAKNLSLLIDENNMTVAGLAREVGISQPVMHRIVAGQIDNPKVQTLLKLSRYFRIPVHILMTQQLEDSHGKQRQKEGGDDIRAIADVPLLTLQQALQVPKNLNQPFASSIPTDLTMYNLLFAIKLNDDSMAPMFQPHSTAIFSAALAPADGHHVLVKVDGHQLPILRQLALENGQIRLKANNKTIETINLKNMPQVLGVLVRSTLDVV